MQPGRKRGEVEEVCSASVSRRGRRPPPSPPDSFYLPETTLPLFCSRETTRQGHVPVQGLSSEHCNERVRVWVFTAGGKHQGMAATCAAEEEAGCNMSNLPASYVTLLLHMAIWSAGCPTDIISAIVGGVRGNCAPDLSLLAITFVAIITTVPYVPSVHSLKQG